MDKKFIELMEKLEKEIISNIMVEVQGPTDDEPTIVSVEKDWLMIDAWTDKKRWVSWDHRIRHQGNWTLETAVFTTGNLEEATRDKDVFKIYLDEIVGLTEVPEPIVWRDEPSPGPDPDQRPAREAPSEARP